MHAGFVSGHLVGSGYRSSGGCECLGASRCVCRRLGPLSLGLSLAPGPPPGNARWLFPAIRGAASPCVMTSEPGAVTRIWLGHRARLDAGTLGVVAGDRHQRGAGDRAALQGVGQLVVCHLVWPRRGRGGLPGGPARSGICWRARPGYSGAGVPLQNLYAASSDQSCGNHLAGAKAGDRTAWRQPCCPSTSGARLPSRRALAPIPCPGSGPACRSGAAQCRPAARAARCWWRPR